MLVLSRKPNERITIDNRIVIEILGVHGNRVRLGIQAPVGVSILREELHTLGLAGGDGNGFTFEPIERS